MVYNMYLQVLSIVFMRMKIINKSDLRVVVNDV